MLCFMHVQEPRFDLGLIWEIVIGFKTQVFIESARNHDTEIDSSYMGWASIELFVLIVDDLEVMTRFDDSMCGEYMVEWM